MVDVFVVGELAVVKVHAVRPLAAYVTIAFIHFVPSVPIDDLIMAQKSLENDSVCDMGLKATFFHNLLESFGIDLLLQLFCVVVAHSLHEVLLELFFDDLMLVVPILENRAFMLARYSCCVGCWCLLIFAHNCFLVFHHVFQFNETYRCFSLF